MTEPLAKILVVDDILANRKLAGKILAGEFEVDAVKSGEEALDFFTRKLPDLVLLDIYMEGMDGFEVLEKIKGYKQYGNRHLSKEKIDEYCNSVKEAKEKSLEK